MVRNGLLLGRRSKLGENSMRILDSFRFFSVLYDNVCKIFLRPMQVKEKKL